MVIEFVISSDLGLWSGYSFGGWRFAKYFGTKEEALNEMEYEALPHNMQYNSGCPCEIKEIYKYE